MRMDSHGLGVDVPQGWDGEIYRREEVAAEGQTFPIVHLANFPLPPDRGDYGSGAVEMMRFDNIFISLVEFGPESVGMPLFSIVGMPTARAGDFDPNRLQRPLAGQSGVQYFFHNGVRAFCLYIVLGSHSRRRELVPEVNQLLSGLQIA